MKTWKAKLRAWLIDLVREAIRVELKAMEFTAKYGSDGFAIYRAFADSYETNPKMQARITNLSVTASKPVTATPIPTQEKSFEQFQDESIAEQANFYTPKEQS